MANNKISVALESATAWAPTPAIYQEYKDYAAKFDRLVEATKEMVLAFDSEVYYSSAPLTCEAVDGLAAALRDIELESEAQ